MNDKTKMFLDNFVSTIENVFPNSNIRYDFVKFVGDGCYRIHFDIAKDNTELSNGIQMNDALHWCFMIDANKNNELDENISIELANNHGIYRGIDPVNFPKEKYLCYSHVKLPYRKISGTHEKCIEKLNKLIHNIATIMLQNAELINQGIIKGLYKIEDKIVL